MGKFRHVLLAAALLCVGLGSCKRESAYTDSNFEAKSEVGIYSYSGSDYIFDSSSQQISRRYEKDGTLTFTIMNPSQGTYMSVSGIDPDAAQGSSMDVTMRDKSSTGATARPKTYSVYVLKKQDGCMWLKGSQSPGFLIKY